MKDKLPNLYAVGLPKTCGTSFNTWMNECTRWHTQRHDLFEIIEPWVTGTDTQRIVHTKERESRRDKGECWTGMLTSNWKDLVRTDPDALYVITVRSRLETWAGSFWKHFTYRKIIGPDKYARRKTLGIPVEKSLPYSKPNRPKYTSKLDKESMCLLLKDRVNDHLELADWASKNPRACVISIDGGTNPRTYLDWLHARVEEGLDGSRLPWSRIVTRETDLGEPLYHHKWPRNRVGGSYEIPLWLVVECTKWNEVWNERVFSQIL